MPEIIVEVRGDVERWTLAAEARRNALSQALVAALEAEVRRASRSAPAAGEGARAPSPRVVVLRGEGERAFCAGADLKERAAMSQAEVRAFLARLGGVLQALERSDCVFVAFLNGAALGGGLELALACDLRVMAPEAELGLPEVTLGILPGAGGTQRLPRLVGPGPAKDLVLTGRRVGPAEALALGLVHRLGDEAAALALAEGIARGAPLALAGAKHAIDEGLGLGLDAALALERQRYEAVLASDDRLEGLRAFAERRPPVFRGR